MIIQEPQKAIDNMKTLDEWHEIITGLPAISEPKKGKIEMHCTICKRVMRRGKCINNECKYFNK